ncbi:MAG: hypothetical protein CMQ47_01040 [Gammaproteobacteria bacterium]|nr:hypothetical protein [Gammaproteobacteria bacterium]
MLACVGPIFAQTLPQSPVTQRYAASQRRSKVFDRTQKHGVIVTWSTGEPIIVSHQFAREGGTICRSGRSNVRRRGSAKRIIGGAELDLWGQDL